MLIAVVLALSGKGNDMGYAVYWANGRWQGYGVTAYCDHDGCKNKIDRGMGYEYNGVYRTTAPDIFVCSDHQCSDLKNIGIDLKKEHPEWLNHILSDDSWEKWRVENPKIVEQYRKITQEKS